MGWFEDNFAGHEGSLIGHVHREGCPPGSAELRELASPLDATSRQVALVSAGCECGWRSARWSPTATALWDSFFLLAADDDNERARKLWKRHITLDVDGERLVLRTVAALLGLGDQGVANDERQAFDAVIAAFKASHSSSR
jgi:hypothetical protein